MEKNSKDQPKDRLCSLNGFDFYILKKKFQKYIKPVVVVVVGELPDEIQESIFWTFEAKNVRISIDFPVLLEEEEFLSKLTNQKTANNPNKIFNESNHSIQREDTNRLKNINFKKF